jgi:glucokinase
MEGAMDGATLAVDLGGTHMRCARVLADGTIDGRRVQPTPHDGTGTDVLMALVRDVAGGAPCGAAVIGVPGRVDYRGGRLEHAPNLPPGWADNLSETDLTAGIGLPTSLANDADLAAVGEAYWGAGRAFSDVVYLTISTGVGAGVVLSGRLVHGRRSLAEIGHSIIALDRLRAGEPSTLEELASGTSLAHAALAVGVGPLGPDVIAAAAAGDPAAITVWGDLVSGAAAGLVNAAWLFSPEVIIVGGGLGLVGDVLLDPLRSAVAQLGPPAVDPPIQVVAAALGDDAGLVGAAAWHRAFRPDAAGRTAQAADRAS